MNSDTNLDYANQKLIFAIEKVLDIYFNNDTNLSGSAYLEAAQTIKTLSEARTTLLVLPYTEEKQND